MKFKKTILILFFFILVFSFICSAKIINNVNPTIIADFYEIVDINFTTLKNSDTSQVFDVESTTTDYLTYYFTPKKSLTNGDYELIIDVADFLGNIATYSYDFTIDVPDTLITLINPSFGVSNTTSFNVELKTLNTNNLEGISKCKYRFSGTILSFDQAGLKDFSTTDGFSHFSESIETSEGKTVPFYVICRDSDNREVSKDFSLTADLTPPKFSFANFIPNPINEYPFDVEPISSSLTLETNELTLCKFINKHDGEYEVMAGFNDWSSYKDFYSLIDEFNNKHSTSFDYSDEIVKQKVNYSVQCEDKAGWKTLLKNIDLVIDLSAALQIRMISPLPASRNSNVILNLTTNKRGFCDFKFKNETRLTSTSNENQSRYHFADLGTILTGKYSVEINCFSGVGIEWEEVTKVYNFIIDTTNPSNPKINTSEVICDSADASFSATDDLSGIDYFIWRLRDNLVIYNNGTTTSTVSVNEDFSGDTIFFNSSKKYYFDVLAVDKAGNPVDKTKFVSTSIAMSGDDTGVKCDAVPPIVTLVRKDNFTVNVQCQDDLSGCFMYHVGYSLNSECNNTAYFSILPPNTDVALTSTSYICYNVSDLAGNFATGSKLFELGGILTKPECTNGVDSDGDGYGWGCFAGLDCDDTDSEIFIGCGSGCLQDSDGDGFGYGCRNGNDCNDNLEAETTICANGCISDNDGDGFGLGCESPDCDGLNPTLTNQCSNGCFDDNDGDGYGYGCMAGLDCNGESTINSMGCANGCISDIDGDGFGLGCVEGDDCSGRDPVVNVNCLNNCISDEDSDGFGLGCDNGFDCNGLNYLQTTDCSNECSIDSDGDGRGINCSMGFDCNDLNPSKSIGCGSGCLQDSDEDNFGLCCEAGYDCDDFNADSTNDCSANCTLDNDCDQMLDFWEINYEILGYGALDDSDEDGFTNLEEFCSDTDPLVNNEEYVFDPDKDKDGVLDECETSFPNALDPNDPFDASEDFDLDTLSNKFECGYRGFSCLRLNPENSDTDGDGYSDNEEIDAETDPCDAEDSPSSFPIIGLIIFILGILALLGSSNYWVYKKYYLPAITPKPAPRPAAPAPIQRTVPTPIQRPKPIPTLIKTPPIRHRPSENLSRDKFFDEQKRKLDERTKMFDTFGAKKLSPKPVIKQKSIPAAHINHPSRTQRLQTKKVTIPVAKVAIPKQESNVELLNKMFKKKDEKKVIIPTKQKNSTDNIDRLSKLGVSDVDKLDSFTKKNTISHSETAELENTNKNSKQIPTKNDDSVSKLSNLNKNISDIDKLDTFSKDDDLNNIKDQHQEAKDAVEALARLSSNNPENKIETPDLNVSSKEEFQSMIKNLSPTGHIDKNVFEVLLKYLMNSKKITKEDVSELLFSLEEQGILDKKDISEVFFNLNK